MGKAVLLAAAGTYEDVAAAVEFAVDVDLREGITIVIWTSERMKMNSVQNCIWTIACISHGILCAW